MGLIYTLTFNPAIDYMVELDVLSPGAVNRSKAERCYFGGKGINVSNVLKELDVPSIALGFIAGFTGEGLQAGLRAQGLDTRFLRVAQGLTRINTKVKADVETEINGMGPTITGADLEKLFAQLEELEEGDTLILSGSIPGCLPPDTYEAILARFQGRGIRFVVDATGPLLLKCLKYRPFLIKPNDRELEEIFGSYPGTDEEIAARARELQAMGARNVLVSLGERGALLLSESGMVYRVNCPRGQLIGSVGAGDSMVAGFLAGYLQTGDYAFALRLGTACGSATAFSPGLAKRETIEALLAQI